MASTTNTTGLATTTAATAATTLATSTDWTLANNRAQERIIQLQQQRAHEASSSNATGISRLRSLFTSSVASRPAFRVGQLDTELLDEELLDLLKGQLWGGLKFFQPSIKEKYEPELLLLLRAALFKLTIWDHNASYGAALQNLRYTDARRSGPMDYPPSKGQKSLYGLITVGGRYLHHRVNLFLMQRSSFSEPSSFTSKLSRFIDTVGSAHSALTLISFTAFLVTGHYRTLLDRVLRMRLVTPTRAVAREVSFEYLNRQLVWHAFTEFLLFILPLLRIGRWRRWWARILRRIRSEGGAAGETTGELAFLPERTCAICYKETGAETAGAAEGARATDITNPYEAVECGHVYCYVCLAGKIELEEGEGWTCLRCGGTVKRCRPWRGGLEGLTGVGDWGEEVYTKPHDNDHHRHHHQHQEHDFSSDSSAGDHDDSDDDILDSNDSELDVTDLRDYNNRFGVEIDASSDVESEETVQPRQNGFLAPGEKQWHTDYADFDDSQYNTAEDYD